jgi:hypothetical protein
MQLHSASTLPPRPSPKQAIPYSSAALRQDVERVRDAWEDCQANRDRNAIYGYLSVVYGLVAWWTAEGREGDRARRALRLQRLEISDRGGSFAAVIRCTADPAKVDRRTRSKWSRVMRYAGPQAGLRALRPVHTPEGRHQSVRCAVLSASGERPAVMLLAERNEAVMIIIRLS